MSPLLRSPKIWFWVVVGGTLTLVLWSGIQRMLDVAAVQECLDVEVEITDFEDRPTEMEWKLLCARLRGLPDLEKLELWDFQISDESLAPLAGHPRLRSVSVYCSRGLTPACTRTFASLPHLRELILSKPPDGDKQSEIEEAMHAALPAVTVIEK